MTRLRIVADEDTYHPQHRIGQQLLDGYSISLTTDGVLVLADVVAILATEADAEGPHDYALAVMTRLARFYGLHLPAKVPE